MNARTSPLVMQPGVPLDIPEAERRAAIGRPTSYKPEFCQMVIDDTLSGYSLGAFAGRVGVDRATVTRWMNEHPEFRTACSRGQSIRLRWWETKAIEVAETGGSGSQGTMVIFGLVNAGREDWKHKQEIEVSGQITLASVVESTMKTIEAKVIEHEPVEPPKTAIDDLF